MSCGELFVNLGGGGSTPPNGMLQTDAAINGSLQVVKDNLGNSSALNISTTTLSVTQASNSGIPIIKTSNGSGFNGDYSQLRLYSANGGLIVMSTSSLAFGGSGAYALLSWVVNTSLTLGDNIVINASGVSLGGGTITQNGALTIKGAGSNILSLRDSSNVEKLSVDNSGNVSGNTINATDTALGLRVGSVTVIDRGSGVRINNASGTQNVGIYYNSGTLGLQLNGSTGLLQFQGATSSFPALKRSSAILQTKLADDSAFAVHEVLSILTQKPTNSNAQKIKFGDKSPITDGALVVLGFDAQWEVEINGSSYWFAGKTSAFA